MLVKTALHAGACKIPKESEVYSTELVKSLPGTIAEDRLPVFDIFCDFQVPISTVRTPLLCDESMGLDEGYMSDQQISVSSELDNNHTKSSLRLSDDNAWQPLINSKTEFVQVIKIPNHASRQKCQ